MIKMNAQTKVGILVVAFLLVAGGAFFGGLKFSHTKSGFASLGDRVVFSGKADFAGGNGAAANRQRIGGGLVAGEIISLDDKSITIKIPDGGSKTVYWSDSTEITKSIIGSSVDLVVGAQVMVAGSEADEVTTAKTIQIK